ncbi:hypothetical protein L1887_24129 [Cichorium endivia]|nr:hypothetical protein L1887_24129 [Cichorium endivia]
MSVSGYSYPFKIWIWETIPALDGIFCRRVNENFPRFVRWQQIKKMTADQNNNPPPNLHRITKHKEVVDEPVMDDHFFDPINQNWDGTECYGDATPRHDEEDNDEKRNDDEDDDEVTVSEVPPPSFKPRRRNASKYFKSPYMQMNDSTVKINLDGCNACM